MIAYAAAAVKVREVAQLRARRNADGPSALDRQSIR